VEDENRELPAVVPGPREGESHREQATRQAEESSPAG